MAPIAGTISKVLKRTGETAAVGEVIGYMEAALQGSAPPARHDGDNAAAAAAQAQAAKTIRTAVKPKPAAAPRAAEPRGPAESPSAPGVSQEKAESEKAPPPRSPEPSPAQAMNRPNQSAAPNDRGVVISPEVPRPVPRAREISSKPPAPTAGGSRGGRQEEVVPMSPIRRRIAQRLVEAQHTAALLTTFNEVDMSATSALRNEHKQTFQDRYGIKLGFMSFFVKATIDALKLIPQVNAEIRGNEIVYHNYYDIGIAVGGGKGLVVAKARDADRMSFAEIELTIADLAHRARENSLQLDELQGGTFTISNGGVYGSMLSTPIVNPPQSGILGLHAIQDRPVAREGVVVIRPMMYVALTYDHRIVDGQGAVTFLKRIKEIIEEPMRMLVEI